MSQELDAAQVSVKIQLDRQVGEHPGVRNILLGPCSRIPLSFHCDQYGAIPKCPQV